MGLKAPSLSSIAAAVVFALSVFGFTLFVWKSFGGNTPLQAKGYRFHVLFESDATQLTPGSQARISGVPVGRVVDVTPRRGRIDAEINLDKRYAPLPDDIRAIVRSKTLLGETYVELTPGSPGAPKLRDGGTLPISQVQAAQGVDQVLSAFDEPTRNDLKRFLNGVADALKDRGEDLNAALGNGPIAIADLNELVTILDKQRPALKSLIRDTGQALGAVASRSADLQSLATAGNDVLSATAARNEALTATVRALPSFLRQLRSTLSDVEGAAGDAAPTLRALRPVAPLVRRALESSNRLFPQVVPLAHQLGPVIDSAQKGLPAATKVVNAAKPFTGVVNPIATGLAPLFSFLLPVSDLLDAYKNEVVTSFANIGASLQATAPSSTGEAHYLRALIPLSNEAIVGYSERPGTNRHNAYIAPGGLNSLAGGLKAYDCRNTSHSTPVPPLGSGTPPCVTQSPWNFRGLTASFPHIDG